MAAGSDPYDRENPLPSGFFIAETAWRLAKILKYKLQFCYISLYFIPFSY